MASTVSVSAKSTRIVIVGAGISGLAAAERLTKHGFSDLFILEATDRIGGRICTQHFGNGWVEIGAQWIHGEDDNSAYEYAIKHDLVADVRNEPNLTDAAFHMDDGTVIKSSLANTICDAFQRSLNNIRKGYSEGDQLTMVESYINAIFHDELNSSKCPEELEQKKALLQWCKYLQCSIEGSDSLSQLSLKSFIQYRECEGNPLVDLKRGYSSLVDSFAVQIPHYMIHLCKPVVRIEQLIPPHPRSLDQYKNSAAKIICQNGSTYVADHVIVTTSLGHLKENATKMFVPPLSAEKLNVIQKLGFGSIDKIFIEFEQPFWLKNFPGYSLAWRPSEFTQDSPQPWYQAIFGFYTVPFATNVLCGWIGGAGARQMESLSDAEIKETCQQILHRFTGIKDLPAIKAITRSAWYSNPYTKGSYSYFSVDQFSNSCLAEPVTVAFKDTQYPVIMFAGEATHPHYYSTVHGAMETGWREADRIISYHTLPTKSNL